MNLLVIGYVWPEPASSAAGYRMLALLDGFRQHDWNVIFASPAEKSIHRADLPARGIDEQSIALNCSSFDAFLREAQPDVVLFDRFMMEEQFGWRVELHCPHALRVLDTEDLSCLRHARHAAAKLSGQVTTDVAPRLLFSDHAKREVAAILRSDLTLMISRAEIQLLTSAFQVDPSLLHYSPFMLQPVTPEQQAQLPQMDQRQHFIAIGNFRHAPNWDAVLWLQQAIWPLIRRQLPEAELHIYGAYPPPKATALDNPRQGFRVKGWAKSASEVMQQARVNLAPLRFGAGLKGKLVDALACGTPSVTTTVGAEGMADEQEAWPGPVADTPEAFAAAALELYRDPDQWRQSQQQGFRLHNRHFAFETHAEALMARLETLGRTLDQHRLNNFTGAMLRHHSMKSTQYMAQWIEAKNRHKTD
ncbi:MAG: glycosyltransferase [Oceanospirillaceae bacterium]|nr:glycosyltransferase [Oceanospirillaceae bacterium]